MIVLHRSRADDEATGWCVLFLCIIGIPIMGICLMVYGCNAALCPLYTYEVKQVINVSSIMFTGKGGGEAPLIVFDTCTVALSDLAGKFNSKQNLIAYGKEKYPIGSEVGVVVGAEVDKTRCYFSKGKYNDMMISGTFFVALTLICLVVPLLCGIGTCIGNLVEDCCERQQRKVQPQPQPQQPQIELPATATAPQLPSPVVVGPDELRKAATAPQLPSLVAAGPDGLCKTATATTATTTAPQLPSPVVVGRGSMRRD